jgi:hypothetical protein
MARYFLRCDRPPARAAEEPPGAADEMDLDGLPESDGGPGPGGQSVAAAAATAADEAGQGVAAVAAAAAGRPPPGPRAFEPVRGSRLRARLSAVVSPRDAFLTARYGCK